MPADRHIAILFLLVLILGCMIASARGHDLYSETLAQVRG